MTTLKDCMSNLKPKCKHTLKEHMMMQEARASAELEGARTEKKDCELIDMTEQDIKDSAQFSNFAQRVKYEWCVKLDKAALGISKYTYNIDDLLLIAWDNMKREIQGARAEAFKEMGEAQRIKEAGNLPPMGVSEWSAHGKKYGYDKFFEEKIREEEKDACKKLLNSGKSMYELGRKEERESLVKSIIKDLEVIMCVLHAKEKISQEDKKEVA